MADLHSLLCKQGPWSSGELAELEGLLGNVAQSGRNNPYVGREDLLAMRVALEQIRSIRKFDDSSTKLTNRVYWLTGALVVLTVVVAVFTVMLWMKHG